MHKMMIRMLYVFLVSTHAKIDIAQYADVSNKKSHFFLSNNNYIYCRIQQGLKYSSKLKIKYSSDYNQKVVIF